MSDQVNSEKIISIVIGTYNRVRFLKQTISTVRKELQNNNIDSEIIVVDGGSTDGTLRWLSKQKDILTIIQHNNGNWNGKPIVKRSWGYFMNLGFKTAQGKYICMLSDDCLVIPGAIANGIKSFETILKKRIKVGALAFYWRNWPEQKKYWIGKTLGEKVFVNHGMYLNSALKEVGYIDEQTFKFYHADGDLCLKLWNKGYVVEIADKSFVEHFMHANFSVRKKNNLQQTKDWAAYQNKWKHLLSKNRSLGSWVYKDHKDSKKTYLKFLQADWKMALLISLYSKYSDSVIVELLKKFVVKLR